MAVKKEAISLTYREIPLPNTHRYCHVRFLCLYGASFYLPPTCTFGGTCPWQLFFCESWSISTKVLTVLALHIT